MTPGDHVRIRGVLVQAVLTWCLLSTVTVSASFIRYEPGFEYLYRLDSMVDLVHVGQFHVEGKVGFQYINATRDGQELLLTLHTLAIKFKTKDGLVQSVNQDFSHWFSFTLSEYGEVDRAFYPKGEKSEILSVKKGIASFLAGKLHTRQQAENSFASNKASLDGSHWQYRTQEMGNEGKHNATYTAQPHPLGTIFIKTRQGHPVANSKSHYEKKLHYDSDLGIHHTIQLDEHFEAMRSPPAEFDPYKGREHLVEPHNRFTEFELPEMKAKSTGKMRFLHRIAKRAPPAPPRNLVTDTIMTDPHHDTRPLNVDLKETRQQIASNLQCLQKNSHQVSMSHQLNKCLAQLLDVMRVLPDSEITRLARTYLSRHIMWDSDERVDQLNMMDALAIIYTPLAQELLVELVIYNPKPDPRMVSRLLIHFIGRERPPEKCMIDAVEQLAFQQWKFSEKLQRNDIRKKALLIVGAIAHALDRQGHYEQRLHAHKIADKLESMLGMHDPWVYQKKKRTLSEEKMEMHVDFKANLVLALGNAGMERSFDHIVSYANMTGQKTPTRWRRSGVASLRHIHQQEAAHVLLKSALLDDNEDVRYEAAQVYREHPKAEDLDHMKREFDNGIRNGSLLQSPADPANPGLPLLRRHKRSFWEGLRVDLIAPGLNWQKFVGNKKVGASFGTIMQNEFRLKIAPLEGYVRINVHDEAFVRFHLGVVSLDIDIMSARICYKPYIEYQVNLLKEHEVGKFMRMAKHWDGIMKKVVGNLKKAVELFRTFVGDGPKNLIRMFQRLIKTMEQLPLRVLNLGKIAEEAIMKLGQLDEQDLPQCFQPTRAFAFKVSKLYNDIRNDVLDFYNKLNKVVRVQLPVASVQLRDGIVQVGKSMSKFFKNPRATMSGVLKGVIKVTHAVGTIVDAKKTIEEACFFTKDKAPYWFNLTGILDDLADDFKHARQQLDSCTNKWIEDDRWRSDDPIRDFTDGLISQKKLKREVNREIQKIIDDLILPFGDLKSIADPLLAIFELFKDTEAMIKEALVQLKKGYEEGAAVVDKIFTPSMHEKFPRKFRLNSYDCSSHGFYPTVTNGLYPEQGVDLETRAGDQIVAPFDGEAYTTDRSNQILIRMLEPSLKGIEILIENIKIDEDLGLPNMNDERKVTVTGGQTIGIATGSRKCYNHIHVVMRRAVGDYVDPTNYVRRREMKGRKNFERRFECADYRLVIKVFNIQSDTIGGAEPDEIDDSPPRLGTPIDDVDFGNILKQQRKLSGFFGKIPDALKRSLGIGGKGNNSTFTNVMSSFFKAFDFRRYKLGTIYNLLHALKMEESKKRMMVVMNRIKELANNRPCKRPEQMSDDTLRAALVERGLPADGSREAMMSKYKQSDNKCPLVKFALPKNTYCTFDDFCLGVECCVDLKADIFHKAVKAYARLDPCNFTVSVGIDNWHKKIQLLLIDYGTEIEHTVSNMGDFLGGVDLKVRYKVELDSKNVLFSLAVGFCSQQGEKMCLSFLKIMDSFMMPLPVCYPNGTIKHWQKVNVKDYLDHMKEKLRDSFEKMAEEAKKIAIEEALRAFGIPKEVLESGGPCPLPHKLSIGQLKTELAKRGLSPKGSKIDLQKRFSRAERTCKWFVLLPLLPAVARYMHCSVNQECMKYECCITIPIKKVKTEFSFRMWMDLDPCDFTFKFGLNGYKKEIVIFNFPWGQDQEEMMGKFKLKYNIAKLDEEKNFLLKYFIVQVCDLVGYTGCLANVTLLTDIKIPIPVCNENFTLTLPGGSIKGFLKLIGKNAGPGALDALIMYMGLDDVLEDGNCTLPTSAGCPAWSLPPLPSPVQCKIEENCYGIKCCVDVDLWIAKKNTHVYAILDICNYVLSLRFGKHVDNITLFTYKWGEEKTKYLGNAERGNGIAIRYAVDKLSDIKSFKINLHIHVCRDGDCSFTIPMIKDAVMPQPLCNKNFSLPGGSVKNFLKLVAQKATEETVGAVYKHLGIYDMMTGKSCRMPSVAIRGWDVQCPGMSVLTLPVLPSRVVCTINEECNSVQCCMHINFGFHKWTSSFKTWVFLDPCDYKFSIGVEKWSFNTTLIKYEWGKWKEWNIGNDAIIVRFKIEKLDVQKKFRVSYKIMYCIDGDCSYDYDVLKSTEFPQPFCNPNAAITLAGDSLGQMVRKASGNTTYDVQRASLRYLRLEGVIGRQQCTTVSSDAVCPGVQLTQHEATCNINSQCNGAECCVNLDLEVIKRPFRVSAAIDNCNYKFSIHFENWKYSASLFNYKWGQPNKFSIGSALDINLLLHKLDHLKIFRIDLSVNVAIDGLIHPDVVLLKDFSVPFKVCDSKQQLSLPGGSIGEFIKTLHEERTDMAEEAVLRHLGMKEVIDDHACHLQPSTKEECTVSHLNTHKSGDVTCNGQHKCQRLECCVNLDLKIAQRNVKAWVDLEQCTNSFTVGVGKWTYMHDLSYYMWGLWQQQTLGPSLSVQYRLSRSEDSKEIIVDFNMLLTSEMDGISERIEILRDHRIRRQLCSKTSTASGTRQSHRRTRRETARDYILDMTPLPRLRSAATYGEPHVMQTLPLKADEWMRKLLDKVKFDNLPFDKLQKKLFNEMDKLIAKSPELVAKAAIWGAHMKENIIDEKHLQFESVDPNIRRDGVASFSQRDRGWDNAKVKLEFGNVLKFNSTWKGLASAAQNHVQKFIVGIGMSRAGADAMGKTLANMRIGDIHAYIGMRNLEPVATVKLMGEIADLMRDIITELVDTMIDYISDDAFKSADFVISQEIPFAHQPIEFFRHWWCFPLGGFISVDIGFGASGYWGMKFVVGAKIFSLKLFGSVVPYVGTGVWGAGRLCLTVVCGELRYTGDILTVEFPVTAEVFFHKFPLDIGLRMDMELIPLILRLGGSVVIDYFFGSKTVWRKNIWEYRAVSIKKNVFNTHSKDPDPTPPEITEFGTADQRRMLFLPGRVRPPRKTRSCTVYQLPNRDYTEPAFFLAVAANDRESPVRMFYNVGVAPGGKDQANMKEWTGPSSVIQEDFINGMPLYMTVTAKNNQGSAATATCKMPTYDVTPPSGRVTPEFTSTSNPSIVRGSGVAYDDSPLLAQFEGIGFAQGVHGDQLVHWHEVQAEKIPPVPSGMDPLDPTHLEKFTAARVGKLDVMPFKKTHHEFPTLCAYDCLVLPTSKCVAINYEYKEGFCELLEHIEGPGREVHHEGSFNYFERLGVGHSIEFNHKDLSLTHNELYYINFKVDNVLNYTDIISSVAIIADFTPPAPGYVNATTDKTTWDKCEQITPSQWQRRCRDVTSLPNHRTIVDDMNSKTVFNGHEPMQDLRWTRSNNYVSANWDGFHDNETGIYGYTWSIGHYPCDDMIHEHHDPHAHLFSESEWTHQGTVHPLPAPYTILPDGRYYVTVRALNKVQVGGPMALTVCHTTPYIIDTSEPLIHEVTEVNYDNEKTLISTKYNATDPESDIRSIAVGLGKTRRDVSILGWSKPDLDLDSRIQVEFKVPDGVPTWVKIRATNNVDLRQVETADKPILVDTTPPIAGQVYDGWIHGKDMQFSGLPDKLCLNWENFFDPESGISAYHIGFGTCHKCLDVNPLEKISGNMHTYCAENANLRHKTRYYGTLVAVNGGHAELNVTAYSSGLLVDLTHPVKGEIVDGVRQGFKDLKYSAKKASVAAQWRNFHDPESGILDYQITVMRQRTQNGSSGSFEVIHPAESVGNTSDQIVWHHFHLHHGDRVKTLLNTTNRALLSDTSVTDGYLVDLTPPHLGHLYDGLNDKYDYDYQASTTQLSCNWDFKDLESGIDHYKMIIYETSEGTTTQIRPERHGEWKVISDPTQKRHEEKGVNLKAGAHYSTRVSAVNGAELSAPFDTSGILVDPTPPRMVWVMAGAVAGEAEEVHDGYVWQSDLTAIQATWRAIDGESDIKAYFVAIGTKPHGTDVLDFTDKGEETDGRITGLKLQLTDRKTKAPVYYVTVKAQNGAGTFSTDSLTSTPIWIEDADEIGYIEDGPDKDAYGKSLTTGIDVDFQKDTTAVTVKFAGFESKLYGLLSHEWAVGTAPRAEDIQPFMSGGIVLNKTEAAVGGGRAGSGRAQSLLPLAPGQKYYATVRAITGAGAVLETVSDGFTVDITPPQVMVNRLGVMSQNDSEYEFVASTQLYQKSIDSLTASWMTFDPESPLHHVQFAAGGFSESDDIFAWTTMERIIRNSSVIPNGLLKPKPNGGVNYLTIQARNILGLGRKYPGGSMTVDTTSPSDGVVTCPSDNQGTNQVECSWEGFLDAESGIKHFMFGVGSEEGASDIHPMVQLPADVRNFRAIGLSGGGFKHQKKYYATVTAVNKVDLSTTAYSNPIVIDATPPIHGMIVELSGIEYVDLNKSPPLRPTKTSCTTKQECENLDATCQKSLSQVHVIWQPFRDPESGIRRYEIAVGTTPGGGQIKNFFEISADLTSYVINDLDLGDVRRVFVTLKGFNGVGMSSVAISNGIYISRVAAGLPPLGRLMVYDGTNREEGDQDFQTSTTDISAWWDLSGEPCPVRKQSWQIERVDGSVYQKLDEVEKDKTEATNDVLELKNAETYFVMLQVTNELGFTFTLRSDGVTVSQEPIIPGRVNDGDIIGYDINYQGAIDRLSSNWDYFGVERPSMMEKVSGNGGIKTDDIGKQQEVDYYEIAIGNDRRFPKTRNNIMPFTNVGLNKTATFFNLPLKPRIGHYYITVRAHSKSFATAEVTSNGIRVGYAGGISGGTVGVDSFIQSNDSVVVRWSGFKSDVGIMFYFVAIGSAKANATGSLNWKQMSKLGYLPEDIQNEYFSVLSPVNVGKDTLYEGRGLTFQHGEEYVVYVIGVDEAGECGVRDSKFYVDLTPPVEGQLKAGPFYEQPAFFASTDKYLEVSWRGYADPDSGLDSCELQLLMAPSCSENDQHNLTVVQPWITLNASDTYYKYMDLQLMEDIPYFVRLRVTNRAKASVLTESAPVLLDTSEPTAGDVKDGPTFLDDLALSGLRDKLSGTILHHADPNGPACPYRSSPFEDGVDWSRIRTTHLWNMKKEWSLLYRPEQHKIGEDGHLEITMERDIQKPRMASGALYQKADILRGGTYTTRIKAAAGQYAVTSVVFWDGPDGTVGDYNAPPPPDDKLMSQVQNCACCHDGSPTKACDCDCKDQILRVGQKQSQAEIIDDDIEGEDTYNGDKAQQKVVQRSCGMQLHPEIFNSSFMLLWCRRYNDTWRPKYDWIPLEFNPADAWHTYDLTLSVSIMDGAVEDWALKVYVDNKYIGLLTGFEKLSMDTKLMYHVWNRDNYIPPVPDPFNRPSTKALFADVRVPPERHMLCRFGKPFRGANNAIIAYEAGVGTTPGGTDVAPFERVASPCIPCQRPCDRYYCSKTCDKSAYREYNFTLDKLNMAVKRPSVDVNGTIIVINGSTVMEPVNYYITVQAVLASGRLAVASSNGFQLDITPPVFNLSYYIDVASKRNNTPVQYQASNDTIKAFWRFEDEESQVKTYWWAIGTYPGGTDLQDFVYVGDNQTGSNTNLAGKLFNNHTYYLSVKARNSAGLDAVFHDGMGVTVLLVVPEITGVNTSLPFCKPFKKPVYPKDIQQSADGSTLGITFTKADDPTVTRYDFCVGSSQEKVEDIVTCFPIGSERNSTGSAYIKDGKIYLNGVPKANISHYRQQDENGTIDLSRNSMNLEPGKTLHYYLRVCNGAGKCMDKPAGNVVIMSDKEQLMTSKDGGDLDLEASGNMPTSLRRTRAATWTTTFKIKTTGGMAKGGSLVTGILSKDRLEQDYTSDATMTYSSYIVNPLDTRRMTTRMLYGRLKDWVQPSIFISSLGQIPLRGPLMITNTFNVNGANWKDNVPKLVYWDQVNRRWSDASETCTKPEIQYDWNKGTVTTAVCDTTPDTQGHQEESYSKQEYFDQETQFSVFVVHKHTMNTAPVLLSSTSYKMPEDSGTLRVILKAYDAEGDDITFSLDQSVPGPKLGFASLRKEGILFYKPEPHEFGVDRIPIILSEDRKDSIPVNSSKATITVNITHVSTNPGIMLLRDGEDLLAHVNEANKTILVTVEEDSGENAAYADFTALYVAYDIDRGNNVNLLRDAPLHGNMLVGEKIWKELPYMSNRTVSSLKRAPNRYTWFTTNLTYRPAKGFSGTDEFKLAALNEGNLYSKAAVISVAVMKNPCVNEGYCQGNVTDVKGNYTDFHCRDPKRAHSFDDYICVCPNTRKWGGRYCQLRLNFCTSTPCPYPYSCFNLDDGWYECRCPDDQPHCDSLEPWKIGLIVVLVALAVGSVVPGLVGFRKWKQKKNMVDSELSARHKKAARRKKMHSWRPSSKVGPQNPGDTFDPTVMTPRGQVHPTADEWIDTPILPNVIPPNTTSYSDARPKPKASRGNEFKVSPSSVTGGQEVESEL